MKVTAVAPSNIAFTKYWGKKDGALKLPANGSISMNLSNLLTTTTVEFTSSLKQDDIIINDVQEKDGGKVSHHLDLVRKIAGVNIKAKVVSRNNFPTGTGLSSSASGFAALTMAATRAAGLHFSEKELSILARKGSGSACRSIPDGFVEWLDGDTDTSSYGISLYPEHYWRICDVVVVVSTGSKSISSSQGQERVNSSPFYQIRIKGMKKKNIELKKALRKKDFKIFGELLEADALELHAVMLTSKPALIYWTPGTLEIMKYVQIWRGEGLPVYFTINTGQDIHLIVEKENVNALQNKLKRVSGIKTIIVNRPSAGTRVIKSHLF